MRTRCGATLRWVTHDLNFPEIIRDRIYIAVKIVAEPIQYHPWKKLPSPITQSMCFSNRVDLTRRRPLVQFASIQVPHSPLISYGIAKRDVTPLGARSLSSLSLSLLSLSLSSLFVSFIACTGSIAYANAQIRSNSRNNYFKQKVSGGRLVWYRRYISIRAKRGARVFSIVIGYTFMFHEPPRSTFLPFIYIT